MHNNLRPGHTDEHAIREPRQHYIPVRALVLCFGRIPFQFFDAGFPSIDEPLVAIGRYCMLIGPYLLHLFMHVRQNGHLIALLPGPGPYAAV